MSENWIVRLLKRLLQLFQGDMTDERAETLCPAGKHSIERSYKECPYCKAEANAKKPSVGRKTTVAGSEASTGDGARRIAGVLVTFSWHKEGQLFTVYEGKNLIGAGSVGNPCDIEIRDDPTMSGRHATIRCVNGHGDVFDEKSQNGTYLNGNLVPVQGMKLAGDAELKTGNTIWRFIMISASAGSSRREESRSSDFNVKPNREARDEAEESGEEEVSTAPESLDVEQAAPPAEQPVPPAEGERPVPMHRPQRRPTRVEGEGESTGNPKNRPTRTF